MNTLWKKIAGFVEEGGRACLVTLLEVRGSSPREAGARLAIRADGRFTGTIGGGALEWQALAEAQKRMRQSPDGAGHLSGVALGPDLGQCCGGHVTLLIEVFSCADLGWITPLVGAEAGGTLFTLGRKDARGVFCRQIYATQSGEAAIALVGDTLHESFIDAPTPLLLFGAGHVGRALVLALAPLPVSTRWIDPRRSEFPEVFPANVTPVAPEDPVREIAAAPEGAMVLAMTHSHALDLAIVAAGLRNPAIREVGVIGSRTKRARFASQLRQAGFADSEISRVHCPIGSGALKSKAPAVIALGVAMQILEWREAAAQALAHPAIPQTRLHKG